MARYEGEYEVEKVLARRKNGVIGGCPGLGCNSKKVKKVGARRLVVTIAECCKQVAEKAGTMPEWKSYKQRLVQWDGKNEDGENWLDTWEPDDGPVPTYCLRFVAMLKHWRAIRAWACRARERANAPGGAGARRAASEFAACVEAMGA